MPSAQCPVPNAQCPMLNAHWPISPARHPNPSPDPNASPDPSPNPNQVEDVAALDMTGDRRFDAPLFAYLVRFVCCEMEPSSELLHAFEVFDPRGHNAVSADALVTHLVDRLGLGLGLGLG